MKGLFRLIGKLFKGMWTLISFTRQLVLNLFFFAIIGGIFFALQTDDAPPQVTTKSALLLDLRGPIVEQRTYIDPIEKITGDALGQKRPAENVLFDIVDSIRQASNDAKITGLVLNLKDMSETNLTKLRYIAKAINEFKAAGKPVYAIGDYYSQSQYYLASYADKIMMSPDGAVMLQGYGTYRLYYKDLLDKLDVSTHVFRVGTYKSFVEPYLRNNMSDEAKKSASAWLTQLWGAYVDDVAHNRQITASALSPNMDEFLTSLKAVNGDLGQLTLNMGLVDQLSTRQQTRNELVEHFGSDGDDSFNAVSYYDYLATLRPPIQPQASDIAIVVASGAILDGNQQQGTIGGDSTAALLRQARLDNKIKAVVLRVDSPGGSAFASEVIRNEIAALKESGKPVVVSMSSIAASGGYWISLSADKILAQPTTLTGSIGIFGILTTFEKGLARLGINSDGVGTTPFSGVGLTRGLSDGVSEAMQLGIEHGYQRFIGLVSKHRNISLEQADNAAQGRVWTGQDALKLGLIDQLGDFDDAVAVAAKLANLETYNLFWVEEPLSPAEEILQQLTGELNVTVNSSLLPELPTVLQPAVSELVTDISILNNFNDPKGQYAFCLNCTNF